MSYSSIFSLTMIGLLACAASAAPLGDEVSVKSFGAVGDGASEGIEITVPELGLHSMVVAEKED